MKNKELLKVLHHLNIVVDALAVVLDSDSEEFNESLEGIAGTLEKASQTVRGVIKADPKFWD